MARDDGCHYCGARFNDDTAATCPVCGRRIPRRRGGWLKWILGALFKRQTIVTSTTVTRTTNRRKIEIEDVAGNLKEYRSIEKLPPELRKLVESAMAERDSASPVHADIRVDRRYTLRDASGQVTTYGSLDEMPPEVRRIFEQQEMP